MIGLGLWRELERARGDDLSHALRRFTSPWLSVVLRASAIVVGACALAGAVSDAMPVWWIYGFFAGVTGIALALDSTGRSRAAGVVLSLGFWIVATLAVLVLGGVRSPGTFVYLPIVVTAALFWSWRAAGALTVATLGVEILAAIMDTAGLLPAPLQRPTPSLLLRIFAGSLTMTAILVGVAVHSLRMAIADVRRYAARAEELLLAPPDAILALDGSGVVTAGNAIALASIGYASSDVVGRHFARIDLFSRAAEAMAALREILRGRRAPPVELMLVRKDGSVFWAEALRHSFACADGSTSTRVVLRDVTRRKLAERRQAEVEEQVANLRRFEQMGLLIGGVSHDVNNLLTVILASASVLESQVPEGSVARELVREIESSAVRAANLERRLLKMGSEPTADTIDLRNVVHDLRHILARLLGGEIELVLHADEHPCPVRADPAHLEQIVLNLAANARDAMPRGGRFALEVRRRPATGRSPREVVELVATDTGVGMARDIVSRMFDPFYTTKGGAGAGLGLATVRNLLEGCGGEIRVDGEPGRGTRIRLMLPISSSQLVDGILPG